MKKSILVASLTSLLAAAPATGQMMGNTQMMEQQQMQRNAPAAGQNNPQYMNPGMMNGYGYDYGMGSSMMGGYGMMPSMMGYGMGPSMMSGYGMMPSMMGYGMGPSMMGGYGMIPNMMGYGMGPAMMGRYGYGIDPRMMSPETEKLYKENIKKNNRFLDETKELRKKLHTLKFEYQEALRSTPEPNEKLNKMRSEMFDLQQKIYNKSLEIK